MTTYTFDIEDRNPAAFDAGDVERALAAHGAKNVSVFSDGTVACEADSDPSVAWDAFQPVVVPPITNEEIAEAVLAGPPGLQKLAARLAAVKGHKP